MDPLELKQFRNKTKTILLSKILDRVTNEPESDTGCLLPLTPTTLLRGYLRVYSRPLRIPSLRSKTESLRNDSSMNLTTKCPIQESVNFSLL